MTMFEFHKAVNRTAERLPLEAARWTCAAYVHAANR
jgi:hypothetical protein